METYPLHEAVLTSDAEAVEAFIAKGVDLDELDKQGNSPLHWAVFGGYCDLVELLLRAGADPNVFSHDGYTPMWSAAAFGLREIIAVLDIYGGKIKTNQQFDRTSWTIIKKALKEPMPEEEREKE